jgi:hypothetical protein
MKKAKWEKIGLAGDDKQQDDLENGTHNELPEGLQRERKGPYDKNTGRDENTSQVPRAFPDRDPLKNDPLKKKTGEF